MKLQRNKAFTLTEVLIAVAIIAILIGLITMAVGKVLTSSKVASTRTLEQTGVNVLFEWKRVTPPNYPTFPWPKEILPNSLEDGANGLNSIAFQLSRATMRAIVSNPSANRLAGNIPAERFFASTVDYSGLPTLSGAPSWDNTSFTTGSSAGSVFVPGYAFKGNFSGRSANVDRFFICFNGLGALAAAATPYNSDPTLWPGNYSNYWMESTGSAIQMLRDAWNHPTLIVPACGFESRDTSGNTILVTSDGVKRQFYNGNASCFLDALVWNSSNRSYRVGDIVACRTAQASWPQWGLFICAAAHASGTANIPDTTGGKAFWDRVPTDPFFASAGPDGIFFDPNNPSTLQDNIYSFER